MTMISRIRGEVDVRYVRCVSELKSGRGELVSSATSSVNSRQISEEKPTHHDGRRAGTRCILQPCSELGRQSWIPACVGNCRNKKKKVCGEERSFAL